MPAFICQYLNENNSYLFLLIFQSVYFIVEYPARMPGIGKSCGFTFIQKSVTIAPKEAMA